jgi:hypothetical protein
LGGGNAPQDAYRWVEARNPRSDSNTAIEPWWTLEVQGEGHVEPRMPTSVRVRDGDQIRPVAPFFEVWALMGAEGSAPSTWHETPLTPALLQKFGADESMLTLQVDAKNRKAARRMGRADLVFGTFPPKEMTVSGNDHNMHTIFGVSPPDARIPMIPEGRTIPLGNVQIMRSSPQPKDSGAPWEDEVNVEVIRFRFTPGRGRFYGPPEAARLAAVDEANAFLDPAAGWFNKTSLNVIEPSDTYDVIPSDSGAPSLGVVDDTCEARVTVSLALPGRSARTLTARANVFVGPPDFGPDRRPFLSLADELIDRCAGADKRDRALNDTERDAWVQDLFERVFETAGLFNLDHFQRANGILLKGKRVNHHPDLKDHVTLPRNFSMTRNDRLRSRDSEIPLPTRKAPLPLSERARARHREMQDLDRVRALIFQQPGRLEELIRQPFEVEKDERSSGTVNTTMRMPPFMRNSNGFALTLSAWQYDLLMSWVKAVQKRKRPRRKTKARTLSSDALARRSRVLARLAAER